MGGGRRKRTRESSRQRPRRATPGSCGCSARASWRCCAPSSARVGAADRAGAQARVVVVVVVAADAGPDDGADARGAGHSGAASSWTASSSAAGPSPSCASPSTDPTCTGRSASRTTSLARHPPPPPPPLRRQRRPPPARHVSARKNHPLGRRLAVESCSTTKLQEWRARMDSLSLPPPTTPVDGHARLWPQAEPFCLREPGCLFYVSVLLLADLEAAADTPLQSPVSRLPASAASVPPP